MSPTSADTAGDSASRSLPKGSTIGMVILTGGCERRLLVTKPLVPVE
jgi:hypothetical protein